MRHGIGVREVDHLLPFIRDGETGSTDLIPFALDCVYDGVELHEVEVDVALDGIEEGKKYIQVILDNNGVSESHFVPGGAVAREDKDCDAYTVKEGYIAISRVYAEPLAAQIVDAIQFKV